MGSGQLALRLATLILIIGAVGLPINDIATYGLVLAATVAVFTGTIATAWQRWAAAAVVTILVVAVHMIWPLPRIQEGHNVFLPSARLAQTSGLPRDVLDVMIRQFEAEYPPERRCDDPTLGCWRPDRPAAADGFAFSADAVFDRSALSRNVAVIGFIDPAYLRLGFINEYFYAWPDNESDVKRFERDRRSLNLFDHYRVTFPLFVMYRFPAAFVGSRLCWTGTVAWEGGGERFETLIHADRRCRDIDPADVGRRIFGISIRRDSRLAMALEPNGSVLTHRAGSALLTLAGVAGIILLLVRINARRMIMPAILIGAALLAALFVDSQFIGGMRPLDSGDDGIAYEGFGRAIVKNVLAGDIFGAMRGVEPVYYFTPGLRYVRALELIVFGETALLYFSAMLLLPILAFALFRRFLPPRWALGLVLAFAVTPITAPFGSSLFQYVIWASRGYADPFATVLLLAALVLIIPPETHEAPPRRGRLFAAGLLFAAATFCRPNLVLASGVMTIGAATIFMHERHWANAVAVLAGFSALALSPLHNYVFGHALVPFSDNVNQATTLLMSPLDYAKALGELARLDFAGTHVRGAIAQLGRWLSGPQEWLVLAPLHAFAVGILVRMGIFGSGYRLWLRLVALATLLQHGIGASYVNFSRYNLGTWLLTLMLATVWFQREGLPWVRRTWPGLSAAWQRNPAMRRLSGMVDGLARALGLVGLPKRDTAATMPPAN